VKEGTPAADEDDRPFSLRVTTRAWIPSLLSRYVPAVKSGVVRQPRWRDGDVCVRETGAVQLASEPLALGLRAAVS
jgi:hypothetical protein